MKKLSLGLLIVPGLLCAGGDTIYKNFHAGEEESVNAEFKGFTTEQQAALPPILQCMVAESNLKAGNYPQGFKRFEHRLTVDNGRDGNTRGKRLTTPWNGSDPKNKNITVITEGGFGDVMSFFLPYVETLQQQGAHVTLALSGGHKRLGTLFREHSTLQNDGIRIIEVDDKAPVTEGDYQVYLMSLPQYLSVDPITGASKLQGTTSENTIPRNPVIRIQDAAVNFWANKLPKDKFVIALCHSASKLPPGQHDRGLDRSVPLNVLVPALCRELGKENIAVVNLLHKFNPAVAASKLLEEQTKRAEAKNRKLKEDAERTGKTFVPVDPSTMVDQEDILNDEYMSVLLDPCAISKDFEKEPFVDTGAIITVLGNTDSPCKGAVGSVDTSVINLAGLIVAKNPKANVRVSCFLSKIRDWRWGKDKQQTPWFPELNLLVQEKRGDWNPVANKFAQQCADWKNKTDNK